jgi:DNA polymerase III sliding clamp (beta) subunit (PCNA family)
MNTTTTQTTRTGLDELTKIVAAIALHASTDQQRYGLTGIYITAENIQATDSYTLGRYTPAEPITTGEPALINARELTTALNNLNKAAGKATTEATLTITGDKWQLTATSGPTTIGSYNGQTIPTEFPNTKQLFDQTKPAETPFEPTGLNPDYLERITKASRKLSKNTPLIMATWQTPQKPIMFTTTTETGQLDQILMPQRINP